MAAGKSATSAQLKAVLGRVKTGKLTAGDKKILTDTLKKTIELRQVLERATRSAGRKKVLASLPFGFDIVK